MIPCGNLANCYVDLLLTYLLVVAPIQPRSSKSLTFDSVVFLMAAALDPRYAFHWLIDHPGSQEDKNALRHQIVGKLLLVFKYRLSLMLLIFC